MTKRPPEEQRVKRLLEMAFRLMQRRWKRAELAEHFGVSERQIQNDILMLRQWLEIEHTREGYRVKHPPALQAISLPADEALALILATKIALRSLGIPSEPLRRALEHLVSLLPNQLGRVVESTTFTALATTAENMARREQLLRKLEEAILNGWVVELEYAAASRQGAVTRRKVDPYALVPHYRSWHLIGWCHTRNAVRTFKLDRIKWLNVTREPLSRPPTIDVGEYLRSMWGIMEGRNQPKHHVELIFSKQAAPWVEEEHWHHTQQCQRLPDGRLRFTVTVPITPDFCRWVFHYGTEVEVVAPEELRQWIIAQAQGILARYHAPLFPEQELLLTPSRAARVPQ